MANYPGKRNPRGTYKNSAERNKVCRDKRAQINKEAIAKIKNAPCMDCGVKYPPAVMEFDHRNPDDKKKAVGSMATTYNLNTILEEIEKCDLVCANCHRIRHFYPNGY